ncbi:uncharacterized protein LOC142548884 [Primulina tabacum]|uniref:uncharacterized protein LOC142548884 n=1 Tax=Primulina tabacum TaxID=48773 RepID=UPI003F5A153F
MAVFHGLHKFSVLFFPLARCLDKNEKGIVDRRQEIEYADPSRTELVPVKANFRIDWHTLNIIKKDTIVKLGIKLGTKRIPVYHGDAWVDTDPIDIKDLSFLDHDGKEIIKSLRNYVIQLQKLGRAGFGIGKLGRKFQAQA